MKFILDKTFKVIYLCPNEKVIQPRKRSANKFRIRELPQRYASSGTERAYLQELQCVFSTGCSLYERGERTESAITYPRTKNRLYSQIANYSCTTDSSESKRGKYAIERYCTGCRGKISPIKHLTWNRKRIENLIPNINSTALLIRNWAWRFSFSFLKQVTHLNSVKLKEV